jgi:hypothetical protein
MHCCAAYGVTIIDSINTARIIMLRLIKSQKLQNISNEAINFKKAVAGNLMRI